MRAAIERLQSRLFAPVDIASLVFARVAFGLIMVWEVWRYIDKGWIERHYILPRMHFPYYGLDLIRAWPGEGMVLHFYALGLAALGITLGCFYRACAAAFFALFSYLFLIDQARYLNHFYLVIILSFLMIVLPAHRALSIDAWRRPGLRSETAPAWSLFTLRAQLAIVYTYAAIAKMNPDWLAGYPLTRWLDGPEAVPIVGPLLGAQLPVAMAWGGMFFDLLIVPAMLYRRTRPYAFALALCFHGLNSRIFGIGIFPYLSAALTTLYFAPGWPRRIFNWPRRGPPEQEPATIPARTRRRVVWMLGVWFTIQLLVPLRHWLYPGDVNWTEEGHRFSWRMKLRSKSGRMRMWVTDRATGETRQVRLEDWVTRRQRRKLGGSPEMVHILARRVAEHERARGREDIEVRAELKSSLNGRRRQVLVPREIDLAAEPIRYFAHTPWIPPLSVPLADQRPR